MGYKDRHCPYLYVIIRNFDTTAAKSPDHFDHFWWCERSNMTKLFSALLLLSCLSVAQSLFWGPCPQVSVKPDFDITSYPGTWYEIARYPTHSPESEDVRCVQGVYGTSDKPNYVTVKNSGIEPDGSITQVVGEAWIPDEDEPGKLLVRFSRCK